jgi:ATP-binding protein involved in chromosome partitioning
MDEVKQKILTVMRGIELPDGENLVSLDLIRALSISNGVVSFVIEVEAAKAKDFDSIIERAKQEIGCLENISKVSIVLTSHNKVSEDNKGQPPKLVIGGHPKPQEGVKPVKGVERIIAIASGKGGVGKSTLSSNLAVALAKKGRRVGLLDADIYGPSQPRMMGVSARPSSPDGKTIIPLSAHGVTMMSIGLMLEEDQAVVWRGPMLMGALQQMLGQVEWGCLDVLIVDLPPGTGDVQLTLAQKTKITGAIVVSTPQDIALLDARKALNMFEKTKTPVLGMIENMSTYVCPSCGYRQELFGHGGVKQEAEKQGLPFLGEIPLDLDIRLASDKGEPIALTDTPASMAYKILADKLISGGMA